MSVLSKLTARGRRWGWNLGIPTWERRCVTSGGLSDGGGGTCFPRGTHLISREVWLPEPSTGARPQPPSAQLPAPSAEAESHAASPPLEAVLDLIQR